ncbi:MAG TPA: hypothetical protein DCW90_07990 [Lachnospiraceae bacterium]|nr:hypothetical protein [uncultured Lachnoclostridium sp.]HAU85431.1 hypothetical protein [Lachnospiraceae bacterium]
MSILTFFPVVFIWIWILHHLKNRASKNEENQSKQFWKAEHDANSVRKMDLSNLPYIHIDTEKLPFKETTDPKLLEIQATMKDLSTKKIVNLVGQSNTDLKAAYGPANLDALSAYDANFTELIRTLSNWGTYLYEQGQLQDARVVLEYGILCKTDIKNNYVLLAKIYHKNNEINKITALIKQADTLQTLMKSSILSALKEIKDN